MFDLLLFPGGQGFRSPYVRASDERHARTVAQFEPGTEGWQIPCAAGPDAASHC